MRKNRRRCTREARRSGSRPTRHLALRPALLQEKQKAKKQKQGDGDVATASGPQRQQQDGSGGGGGGSSDEEDGKVEQADLD